MHTPDASQAPDAGHQDVLGKDAPLEPIPNKLYFTIGEVSELCAVPAHVLRYWERKVPQLSQVSRRNNRRYYKRQDVMKVRRMRELVYGRGMTIKGAIQALKERQASKESQAEPRARHELRSIRQGLQEVSRLLARSLKN